MIDSLSLIVPVHDAQSWLSSQVRELLDVLPELTSDFQIVIVDDGSTDQTSEVAVELARQFPQITAVIRGAQQGPAAAAQAGLRHATGQIVFVQPPSSHVRSGDLCRLWRLRNDPELVAASSLPRPLSDSLIQRLAQWGRSVCEQARGQGVDGGIQVLRRQASSDPRTPSATPAPAQAAAPFDKCSETAIPETAGHYGAPVEQDALLDWSVKAIYS